MDKFENQLKDNRSEFEHIAPHKDLMWDKISAALPAAAGPDTELSSAKASQKFTRFRIAFLLLCFTALGFLAGKFLTKKEDLSQQYAAQQSIELLELDQHYTKLVSYQMVQLKNSPRLGALEKEEFLVYINQLGREQQDLKEELKNNIDNQEVLEAIIENYQQQISLITELLDRLDRTNKTLDYDSGIFI